MVALGADATLIDQRPVVLEFVDRRNLGIGLLVIWVISIASFREATAAPVAANVHLLNRYSIGLERMARPVQTAQF
jgi:hypothetical protein